MQRIKKVSNKKGFVFSFEAIIALTLFALMLFAIPQQNDSSLKELLILQQENDLIKVWSVTNWDEQTLISDTKLMFNENAEVWVNEKNIFSCKKRKNSIASEGILLDQTLNENKIKLVVYYD